MWEDSASQKIMWEDSASQKIVVPHFPISLSPRHRVSLDKDIFTLICHQWLLGFVPQPNLLATTNT
ncbi:MAG: hypothetical protein F6K31_39090 [Symploca sp. SIO2G7]|nr:hypothetical protein [Symploca sp. SIO2G7]